jgi:ATP-binding cassette subfamily F protein uup
MESAILDAEANVEALQARVSDPQVLADHVKSHEAFDQLAGAQHEVERLYARWAELDARK